MNINHYLVSFIIKNKSSSRTGNVYKRKTSSDFVKSGYMSYLAVVLSATNKIPINGSC